MRKGIRISISLCLVLLLFLSLTLTAFAETLSAEAEKDAIIAYYADKQTPVTSARQVILFSAVGALRGKTLPDIRTDDLPDAVNDALCILAALSLGLDPTEAADPDPVAALTALQRDDGGFGTLSLENTVYVMQALQAAQAFVGDAERVYSAQSAVRYLLSLQKADGGFGSVYETSLAVSYLSYFRDEATVRDAISRAVNDFMKNALTEDGGFAEGGLPTLSAAIAALTDAGEELMSATWHFMPQLLASYKNADGTYRLETDGEEVCNDDAMLEALAAYDAVLSGNSTVMKLMKHGTYALSIWKNIREYVYVFGALAVLSLVFWGYILFGRKKAVDKPQGDNYEV